MEATFKTEIDGDFIKVYHWENLHREYKFHSGYSLKAAREMKKALHNAIVEKQTLELKTLQPCNR